MLAPLLPNIAQHGPLIRASCDAVPSKLQTPTMKFMNSLLCWTLLAISVSATPLSTPSYNAPGHRSPYALAPLMVSEHPHGTVNNSYIVMFKDDVHPGVMDNHLNFLSVAHDADPLMGAKSGLRKVYNNRLVKGYSGMFTDSVVERIREMPEVDYVERDQIVRTQDVQKSAPWVSSVYESHTALGLMTVWVLRAWPVSATDRS